MYTSCRLQLDEVKSLLCSHIIACRIQLAAIANQATSLYPQHEQPASAVADLGLSLGQLKASLVIIIMYGHDVLTKLMAYTWWLVVGKRSTCC